VTRSALLFVVCVAACGGSSPPPDVPAAASPPASASAPPGGSAAAAPTAPSSATSAPPAASPASVIDAADRDPKDRELDAGRHPAELLSFAGITPGMHVAELFAGGGYTSEILARAVGPSGVVYAENNRFILEKYASKPWADRLAKPVMKNVVRVDRELDDPLPPEAKNLDAVFFVLSYHDTVWMKTDRDKMNKVVFNALKPGGEYVVVDHFAKDGSGVNDVKTLHRIDKSVVVADAAKAGFKLSKEGDFLRNPSDTRDWNDSPMAAKEKRGTSDRFVLVFVKP
jgi:predicted methyltransferase